MTKQTLIFLVALITIIAACKTSKTPAGGSSSQNTSSTNSPATPDVNNTKASQMLDEIASSIKEKLTNVDVTRTKEGVLITFDPQVSFNTDSYDLKPDAQKNIKSLADIMAKYAGTYIDISGHADSTGNQKSNLKLSKNRANAFSTQLKKDGVDAKKLLVVEGYGATRPKATNQTPEGRKANRRIDALITIKEAEVK